MYHLYLHGRKSVEQETGVQQVARLIFDPDDVGDKFLRNVGSHMDYMMRYQKR
jgi:hypothetical protein